MEISVKSIVEDGLIRELQLLITSIELDLITAGQMGRLICDVNRFQTGAIPVINQQRKVYTDNGHQEQFEASYQMFLNSTEHFDRPVMIITGSSQYHKPIFNGIIEFY